jgi:peptidylprolyl isomerase
MKKLAIVFLSATLLSSASFAADNVLATYKGGDVKESQVMEQFKPMLDAQEMTKDKKFSDLDANTQETLVKAYVNIQLLNQEAKNQNIDSSPEFKKKIEDIKSQLIQQMLIENYLKTAVTDDMVNKAYDDLVKSLKGQREIKVAHILVATEEEAKKIKKQINKDGSNFAELAKKFSTDTGTKTSGGELGYILKGQLVPSFEEVAFALKKKEISDPVLTQFGYHIIKVIDERPATIPTKEEAKSRLVAQLNKEAIEKYFSDLTSKADVKLSLPKKAE